MYGIESKNIAYMGDDIPDYEVLKQVGLSTCPKDAAPEIRGICRYISPINGGKGCVRDLIEQVLKIQGDWMKKEDIIW
jgi:3-deoxy-D-manno-octulosonate 8-phosphate phosphatase (KDO 8-P phosphatase)